MARAVALRPALTFLVAAVLAPSARAGLFGGLFGAGSKGSPGGGCAGCTLIVGLVEQLAVVHNQSVAQEVSHICDLFPKGAVHDACVGVIKVYGPAIIAQLEKKETPDVVCRALKLCGSQPSCNLFPAPKEGLDAAVDRVSQEMEDLKLLPPGLPKICNLPGLEKLCEIIYGNRIHHPNHNFLGPRTTDMQTMHVDT